MQSFYKDLECSSGYSKIRIKAEACPGLRKIWVRLLCLLNICQLQLASRCGMRYNIPGVS